MRDTLTATLVDLNRFSTRQAATLKDAFDPASDVAAADLGGVIDAFADFVHFCDRGPTPGVHGLRDRAADDPALAAVVIAGMIQRKMGVEIERAGREDGLAWVEIGEPVHGELAVKQGALLISDALRGVFSDPDALQARFERIIENSDKAFAEPFTHSIFAALDKRGVPWRRWADAKPEIFIAGVGARARWFRQSCFEGEGSFALMMAKSKAFTSAQLDRHGVSTPRNAAAASAEEAVSAAAELGFPVVLKPAFGGGGNGVVVGLNAPDEVRRAFPIAAKVGLPVLVERFFDGRDCRVLMIDGVFDSASWRRQASVVGDGVLTLRQLIAEENRKPHRGAAARFPTRIIDVAAIEEKIATPYRARGYDLDAVPAAGEEVKLSYIALRSEGCEYVDLTESVHPTYRALFERIARISGVKVLGIDVIARSLSAPMTPEDYVVNEVNAFPAMNLTDVPGAASRPSDRVVRSVFPTDRDAASPVAVVISDMDRSKFALDVGRIVEGAGHPAAVACGAGYIHDGNVYSAIDCATCEGSAAAFADRSAEAIVVERRPAELRARGLGAPFPDVLVIENAAALAAADLHEDGLRNAVVLNLDDGASARDAAEALLSLLKADRP